MKTMFQMFRNYKYYCYDGAKIIIILIHSIKNYEDCFKNIKLIAVFVGYFIELAYLCAANKQNNIITQ